MASAAAASNDRLMLAVLIASTLHVLVIFGVTFDAWRARPTQHQVEVTLVQTPGRRPSQADHIALPQPVVQAAAARASAAPGRERLATPAVTSTSSSRNVVDRRGADESLEDLPEAERELARLHQELARLQADLDAQRKQQSRQNRVRRLDAVSARAAVDAAYLADWRRRVEAVGNQYYPEASLRYGIFGSLQMLVTVENSGELEDIRILKSSGYAVLDEAAIRIVRMAAPFSPFPEELRATTDKLEILRTWQFEQNALSSGQGRPAGATR